MKAKILILDSPKKRTKYLTKFDLPTRAKVFCSFFWRIEKNIFAFEIYWPLAYIFYFKEYSGNWTCQLESYHQSHENDHNFGRKANGSIHVNVIPKSEITNLITSKEKVPNGPKKESLNPRKKVQNITSGLAHANSFDLVKVEPKNATVLEGSNLDLFCSVNEYFGFCTFYHSGKNCEFQWKKNSWNFTNYDCPGNPFGHPAVLIEGLYNNETCGIRLTQVTKVII